MILERHVNVIDEKGRHEQVPISALAQEIASHIGMAELQQLITHHLDLLARVAVLEQSLRDIVRVLPTDKAA